MGFWCSNMHSSTFQRLIFSHFWHLVQHQKLIKIVYYIVHQPIWDILYYTHFLIFMKKLCLWLFDLRSKVRLENFMIWVVKNRSIVWLVAHCLSLMDACSGKYGRESRHKTQIKCSTLLIKGVLNLGVASTLSAIFSRARLRHFETDKKNPHCICYKKWKLWMNEWLNDELSE